MIKSYPDVVVLKVVDGDTIDVMIDLGFRVVTKQRIRLARIDTPERGEDNFEQATNKLKELILDKQIMLDTHKPSKYGYFLGEVYLNGENIKNKILELVLAKT